ncbi:hypothetical protein BVX97_00870 [bacterium E08(2017)]|nr:hypothetical protein BVX97_00870 [bacterium E08(2017)]
MHAGGEPLMQPRIFDMINYAHDAGIGTWMSSNATILNEDKAGKLLESGLDALVLSIDATTAETYEKIRVGGNFEKTKSNILRFLEMRKDAGSNLLVTIQAIEMEENKHEMDEFREFWSKFDANLIIKPMINWDIKGVEDMKYPDVMCDRPWYWLFVRSTGLVPPCGHDYEMKAVFGDLNKNTVSEIWNSEAAQKFRESLRGGKKGHYVCSHCDYAPARKRGLVGNTAQTSLDMLTICKMLFWMGYHKVNRSGK